MASSPLPHGALSSAAAAAPAGSWRSYALEGVTQHLREFDGLQVLDLGGLNQPNLDYITGLGHRLYAEDLLRAYDSFFTPQELSSRAPHTDRVNEFIDHTLEFPDQSCDGALVWDTLQFIPLPVAEAVVTRLHRILSPNAPVLAFFHRDVSHPVGPSACRVADNQHLTVQPRLGRRQVEPFPPRAIERLFGRFRAVKFYLTRENHQEVIARR
jgi:hypothetical protein